MTALHVWMAGKHIATVTESRGKMKLNYVPGVAPLGLPLISVAMPMSSAPYTDKVVRPFFHGLLPEGLARQTIAYDFGVDAGDDVGLLGALGRDCAGALMVLPEGEAPATDAEPPEMLDDGAIEQRLRALGEYPLGVTGKVRASLPGVQPKLLLWGRGGKWFSPDAMHPSTHILKPSIAELPASVANEAFCMKLAARAGLRAAVTSVARFGKPVVLVSERYDRQPDAEGSSVRIHQEDACQALSVMTHLPKHKYEAHGGPKLRKIAEVLTAWNGSKVELLRHVTFSVLVGNADLHGKNISFLHQGDGSVQLAPMYDVMCTTYYDGSGGGRDVDTELGLFIGTQTDILRVTLDDLVAQARSWGIRATVARTVVTELANTMDAEIDRTRVAIEGDIDVPDSIVERIRVRTRTFA